MVDCERCAVIHYVFKHHGGTKPDKPIQKARHITSYYWTSTYDYARKRLRRWLCDYCKKEEEEHLKDNPLPQDEGYTSECAFKAECLGITPDVF